MYGLVNNSFKIMIERNHGTNTWVKIAAEAGTAVTLFLNDEGYPDEITFSLVVAASNILQTPVSTLLQTFGRYWVTETASKRYGSLMNGMGSDVKTFLRYLPILHDRIQLSFPKLKPPIFRVASESNNQMVMHYISERKGLSEFVVGLFLGIGDLYGQTIDVKYLPTPVEHGTHEIFTISW